MNFEKWLDTFLEEKNLPEEEWFLDAPNGVSHYIGTESVIEHIKIAPKHEQAKIKDIIVKIDFANGNVNHFFKYLAQALVNNY